MTSEREIDRLLDFYFDDGRDELADRVIDAALDEIDHTRQRRAMRVPWRFRKMTMPLRLATAALIGALVLGGAFLLTGGGSRPSTAVPAATPSAVTPSPTPASVWIKTGNMAAARTDFAATLLPDGRVLVVGGRSAGKPNLDSAETYDPATGRWTSAGKMSHGRNFPTATLLRDGKVLVVGGAGASDLFDPATGSWTTTGATLDARGQHVAVGLPDGRVLVAGGNPSDTIGTSEVYDPATGTWSKSGDMTMWRASPSITLLDTGKVLVTGGFSADGRSAELYDPTTGTWKATSGMANARGGDGQTATKLADGTVLVTGLAAAAERFDPVSGTWTSAGNLTHALGGQTATSLGDGRVLVAGGAGGLNIGDPGVATVQTYDAATGGWAPIADMPMARISGQAVRLADGRVLIAGGLDKNSSDGTGAQTTAVIFDPAPAP